MRKIGFLYIGLLIVLGVSAQDEGWYYTLSMERGCLGYASCLPICNLLNIPINMSIAHGPWSQCSIFYTCQ